MVREPTVTLRRIPFDDMESTFKWGRPGEHMRNFLGKVNAK